MSTRLKARIERPGDYALRERISSAIGQFVASRERVDWELALSSSRLQLIVSDEYEVSIGPVLSVPHPLVSVPLLVLRIDKAALQLGGGVSEVALDLVARAVVRKIDIAALT